MFSNPEKNIEQFKIGPGMKVADFGTGGGAYTVAAARQVGDDGKVYALEIQKDLISEINSLAQAEGLSNVETVWADLEAPNGSTLADGAVDAVIVANILFQIENKEQFLREAYRVLRQGGKMLLVDWSESFGGLGPQQQFVVPESQARNLVEQVGFVFSESIQAGEHHYGSIFTK